MTTTVYRTAIDALVSTFAPVEHPMEHLGRDGYVNPTPRGPTDQKQSRMGMAGFNRQEMNLYMHHFDNLNKGGSVKQPNGATSTLYAEIVPLPSGKQVIIPTVWNGKILSSAAALDRAKAAGISRWPQYASQKEAETRYNDMHKLMEQDLTATEQ